MTANSHFLSIVGDARDTRSWLWGIDGVRFVMSPGVGGVGMGVVIQNADGSVVVAEMGDTLVYDNGRVDVERRPAQPAPPRPHTRPAPPDPDWLNPTPGGR